MLNAFVSFSVLLGSEAPPALSAGARAPRLSRAAQNAEWPGTKGAGALGRWVRCPSRRQRAPRWAAACRGAEFQSPGWGGGALGRPGVVLPGGWRAPPDRDSWGWRTVWRPSVTMAAGPSRGLPNPMNSRLLPAGPQQLRSEAVSQAVGSAWGAPEPRASRRLAAAPTQPRGFGAFYSLTGWTPRRGPGARGDPPLPSVPVLYPLWDPLLGHDVVGAGVGSGTGQPWA